MKTGKIIGLLCAIFSLAAIVGAGAFLYTRYHRVMSENGFLVSTASVCVGAEYHIPIKGSLEDYQWVSANPEVARAEDGILTAKSSGNTTITASKYWYRFVLEVQVTEHAASQATCTEASICGLCGVEMEAALGHVFTEPTCTEDSKCERCGTVGEKKALGHDCEAATCTEASVCKTCKQELEPALGHMFTEPTCLEDSKCQRCEFPGEEKALGHDMLEATCVAPVKCSRCEYSEGEALGHLAPKKMNCSKDTLCERCGDVMASAGEHKYAEATCTKPKTCKVCKMTEGKALGHSYSEATCEQKATCERCGKTTGSFAQHYYVEVGGGRTICAYCGADKPAYTGGSSSSGSSSNEDISTWGNRVLELINEERAKEGLGAMVMDSGLVNVATVRANETVQSFSHTRPDGRDCFTAYDEQGVSYFSAGENIAYGYSSPEAVMKGWMNSPGHRANILNAGFGRVGVGVVKSGGRYYWVQNFAD